MNRRTHRKLPSIVICLLLTLGLLNLLLAGAPVKALEKPGAGAGDVSESTGAFSESIDLEVPDFHDLEPDLNLSYSSSGGNGFVGVGWSLTGDSMVERTSPGGGAPRYDASDIYMLDGEELVANCGYMGGSHCTKRQSYQRIQFDAASNQWWVWSKDGTKSVYIAPPAPHFRWMLASRTDTNGNMVSYQHRCLGSCYLEGISYGSSSISFYREARPDWISFAMGTGLRTTTARLKSIVVSSSGIVRAYQLSYSQSASSGRSLLTSIQEYGKDVSLPKDATGTPYIAGGSALPPITFTWQPNDLRFGLGPVDGNWNASGLDHAWNGDLVNVLTGDFNGDGKADILRQEKGAPAANDNLNTIQIRLSNGNGSFRYAPVDVNGNTAGLDWFWNGDLTNIIPADINSDGRTDLVRQEKGYWGSIDYRNNIQVYLANADGSFRLGPFDGNGNASGLDWPWNGDNITVMSGDFNGDGKPDLLRQESDGNVSNTIQIRLGNGDGSFGFAPLDDNGNTIGLDYAWNAQDVNVLPGDFNGDGRTDLARQEHGYWGNVDQLNNILIYLANADGSFRAGKVDGNNNAEGLNWPWGGDLVNVYPGDFNADGKTDLLRQEKGQWGGIPGNNIQVYLSNGNGSFTSGFYDPSTGNAAGLGDEWNGDLANVLVSDFNGDGRSDILRQEKGGWATDQPRTIELYLAQNEDTFRMGPIDSTGNANGLNYYWSGDLVNILPDDFNGDGQTDLLRQEKAYWGGVDYLNNIQLYLQPTATPDLVRTINNGMGGTITISYVPSSRWSSVNMPPGSISQTVEKVEVSDGRGVTGSTIYTYEGARWSTTLKQSLGYYKTTATEGDGTRTETFHRQTDASPAVVEEVKVLNSAGQIYTWLFNQYQETGLPIYSSLVRDTYTFEYNLTASGRGVQTSYTYDSYGNVTSTVDHGDILLGGDEVTTYTGYYPNTSAYIVDAVAYANTYAGIGNGGAFIDQTLNLYDGSDAWYAVPVKGNLTKVRSWNSQTGGYSDTSTTYHPNGTIASRTDPLGRISTISYDPSGLHPAKICNALSQCATQGWDTTLGLPTSVTDENNAMTTSGYDAFGRKITEKNPAGHVTTWNYLNWGSATSQYVQEILPNGLSTLTFQDGLGRVYKQVKVNTSGATIASQDTIYRDASAEVWKQSLWYGPGQTPRYAVTEYDGLGRTTKAIHPDGSSETTFYRMDNAGKPFVAVYDELGHETVTWTDTDGNVIQVREKNGGIYHYTAHQYDLLGHKVRTVDAAGNVSTTTYNSLGHKLATSDPDMGAWTYTYNLAGQRISQTNANAQTTTYTYDALGRMTTKTTGAQMTTWYYDEAGYGASIGHLTRVIFPGGEKRQSWNTLALPTTTTTCIATVCQAMQTSYDSMKRVATLTYPDGEVVTYGYDASGNLSSVSGYVTAMTWSPAGQLKSMTYANGATTTYTYDDNREWLNTASVAKGASTLYTATYGYDFGGKVKTMTQGTPTASTTSYSYDDLDRLTGVGGAQTQTFDYDAIGNITTSSSMGAYTYDPAHKHAVKTAGTNSYSYDANGNMLSGAGRTMTWDADNRLTSATKAGVTTTFTYGESTQRLTKTTNGVTTRYFSGLSEQVNGTAVQYYQAGPILVAKKTGTTKTFYHADRLGSIRLMTDANGVAVRTYDYLPYGSLSTSTGTASNERGFTGHITDGETGLTYMNARYYDALLGRFVSADSLIPEEFNPQALNRYSYVFNNPVNNTDPTGHKPKKLSKRDKAVGRLWQLKHAADREMKISIRQAKRGNEKSAALHASKALRFQKDVGKYKRKIARMDARARARKPGIDVSATSSRSAGKNKHVLKVGGTQRLKKIDGPLGFSLEISSTATLEVGKKGAEVKVETLKFKLCGPFGLCMTLTGPSFGIDGDSRRTGSIGLNLVSASVTLPIPLPGPMKLELTLGASIGLNAALRKNGGKLGPAMIEANLKKD